MRTLRRGDGSDVLRAAWRFGGGNGDMASFACAGVSGLGDAQGQDMVSIQGDVADDILDLISEGKDFWKDVPEDNVEMVEDKKKKGSINARPD